LFLLLSCIYKGHIINTNITHEEVLQNLSYDKDTGDFFWKVPKQGRQVDKPAGHKGTYGYIQIKYKGQMFLAHRLAFFYMTGAWPPEMVGFKDDDQTNLRWNNLYLKSNEAHYSHIKAQIADQQPKPVVAPTRILTRARFTNAQVTRAVEDFIKNKTLVNGVYV